MIFIQQAFNFSKIKLAICIHGLFYAQVCQKKEKNMALLERKNVISFFFSSAILTFGKEVYRYVC